LGGMPGVGMFDGAAREQIHEYMLYAVYYMSI
jgi:hypothetical protein